MKKLLITGASGFLGWNLCQAATQNWQVWGTYFSHQVNLPGINLVKIDLRDFSALQELFKTIQPDGVIHTAAASKPNFCQTNPELSYSINVTASLNIARLCADRAIPCAFTSTDLVFDGKNPVYQEDDPVSPICYYGEQKVTAENQMRSIYPAIAICRMPLMFGVASPVADCFLQGMISNLKQGNSLNLFIDEYRTPASTKAASQGLLLAIKQQVSGIWHLGGKTRISRYDFGLLLADLLSATPELIQPVKQEDVTMAAPRSPDTSLNSSKAFAIGYQPRSIREELTEILSMDNGQLQPIA